MLRLDVDCSDNSNMIITFARALMITAALLWLISQRDTGIYAEEKGQKPNESHFSSAAMSAYNGTTDSGDNAWVSLSLG